MNLYFECNMGAAGDMIASALVDLFEDKAQMVAELNALGLPQTVIEYREAEQCGIRGAHLAVVIGGEEEVPDAPHHPHHHGRSLAQIQALIRSLHLSEQVEADALAIYAMLARAESAAHGKAVGEVHFHELGMLDALADIVMAAYLIRRLAPEKILCSPVNVGSGTVRCAHGVMPVPAPATAELLKGIAFYKSEIPSELCTPTGAAVLRYFVQEFTPCPQFTELQKTGIGCGTKRFEQANILRVFSYSGEESITELACNIDDMTGEEAAFAAERMRAAGCLDCFISPILMKKGRPAYLFTVLCRDSEAKDFAALVFKHTTTLGIRKYTPARYTLEREMTEQNGVHIKRAQGFGTSRQKVEFEDAKALALKEDISIFEAKQRLSEHSELCSQIRDKRE